jgi:hypothetical protein
VYVKTGLTFKVPRLVPTQVIMPEVLPKNFIINNIDISAYLNIKMGIQKPAYLNSQIHKLLQELKFGFNIKEYINIHLQE